MHSARIVNRSLINWGENYLRFGWYVDVEIKRDTDTEALKNIEYMTTSLRAAIVENENGRYQLEGLVVDAMWGASSTKRIGTTIFQLEKPVFGMQCEYENMLYPGFTFWGTRDEITAKLSEIVAAYDVVMTFELE